MKTAWFGEPLYDERILDARIALDTLRTKDPEVFEAAVYRLSDYHGVDPEDLAKAWIKHHSMPEEFLFGLKNVGTDN